MARATGTAACAAAGDVEPSCASLIGVDEGFAADGELRVCAATDEAGSAPLNSMTSSSSPALFVRSPPMPRMTMLGEDNVGLSVPLLLLLTAIPCACLCSNCTSVFKATMSACCCLSTCESSVCCSTEMASKRSIASDVVMPTLLTISRVLPSLCTSSQKRRHTQTSAPDGNERHEHTSPTGTNLATHCVRYKHTID